MMQTLDWSDLTWFDAFNALCAQLAREYPFTQWKGIDWDALGARIAPRVAHAQAAQSPRAYYLALRELVYAIPDARMQLWGDDLGLRLEQIGGSFGLILARLDDDRILVSAVKPARPAAGAGISIGAQVMTWDNLPIDTALARTSILWAEHPPATHALYQMQQLRLLTRAPIGTTIRVTFRNAERGTETIPLVAENDQFELFQQTALAPIQPPGHTVIGKILPSGIGVLTLDSLAPNHPRIYERFQKLLREFIAQRVIGIVLDLRQCGDGDDMLAASLAGFFHRQPIFYAARADAANAFALDWRDPHTPLRILPQPIYYDGPVAALIGARTSGAAEGLARGIQRAHHGTLVGSCASSGTLSGALHLHTHQVQLPGGYLIEFPTARELNQDGVIQIESNRFGVGGVVPNVRVPLNQETWAQQSLENRDVELAYAVYALTNTARQMTMPKPQAQVAHAHPRWLPDIKTSRWVWQAQP